VRTGNFPGVTVEQKISQVIWGQTTVDLIDLPGTYSLSARSPDEMVTVEVLTGSAGEPAPDVIVCVCNASALERNLFLVSQVRETGIPTVVCLNMWDAAERAGLRIDVARLSEELQLPVITTSALHHKNLDGLRDSVLKTFHDFREAGAGSNTAVPNVFSPAVSREIDQLENWVREAGCCRAEATRFLVIRSLFDAGGPVEQMLSDRTEGRFSVELTSARGRLSQINIEIPAVEATDRYFAIGKLLKKIQAPSSAAAHKLSDRLDAVLTHRILGFGICILVMLLVFSTIYWFTQPLSDGVDALISSVSDAVRSNLSPGPFRSLLTDGIISGVGSVLVFLPQICLLFLFIAVLEDCGYMARAAFMMDRVMAVAGLSGRSFLPLMSSFACAVPAIMATRVIEDRKDRFVTIMIAPLMSCSARLPVYVLMIGLCVPDTALGAAWLPFGMSLPLRGVVLLGISLLGMFVALPVAVIFRKTVFRGEPSPFLLELPDYRLPSFSVTFHRVRESAMAFVKQAGTLIFSTSVLIWFAGNYPGSSSERWELTGKLEALQAESPSSSDSSEVASEPRAEQVDSETDPVVASTEGSGEDAQRAKTIDELTNRLNDLNAEALEQSLLGRFGHLVEPLVTPLGWDWRIGVGVIASFPAREVIVATMGTIFHLGADVTEEDEGLRGALRDAKHSDGRPVFTLPVAASVMVFFALCAQCISTLAVIRNETRSWRWPIISFVYMTVLAWVGAFVTYQVGIRL
ncbi:MAG: ferrous iron transport protein B, partial [Planctomyces sp.]